MAGRVRQPIDVPALEKYVAKNVPEIKVPLEVKQFGFGQSNPTYQITSASGQRYVLRKKPPGKLLSTAAHQVEREHRIITALGPTDVPVPAAYCLCEDKSVIGTAFYIMEFLDGRIIEDAAMLAFSPDERFKLWQAAVTTLAKLHRVDYEKFGLKTFGKSSGFYNRQLATWQRIGKAQEQAVDVETKKPVGAIPHFDQLLQYFATEQPEDRATIVHGDFKIDNLVFHKTEPRVIGVLDWEMSTIGHPLSDLCNLMGPFFTSDAGASYYKNEDFKPGATPGLPTPQQIMGWYTEITGWNPQPDLKWAVAFSVMRASVICQGIAARAAQRQATSEQAKRYADSFVPLGEFAWRLVEERRANRDDRATEPKL